MVTDIIYIYICIYLIYIYISSKNLEAQRCVAEAFVKQFQLSQEELDRIYGSGKNEMPIDDNFFKILDRIKQIRNECRSLSQFGFKVISDIIDQMTIHEVREINSLFILLEYLSMSG